MSVERIKAFSVAGNKGEVAAHSGKTIKDNPYFERDNELSLAWIYAFLETQQLLIDN